MTVRARTPLVEEVAWHIARARVVLALNATALGLVTTALALQRRLVATATAGVCVGTTIASTVLLTRMLRAVRARA